MKKILFIFFLFAGLHFNAAAQNRSVTFNASKVLKFYPNPATIGINFEFQGSFDRTNTLQIFNFVGKKVYEITNLQQRNYISLTSFYRGVYVFQLRDKAGRIVESNKFQVVK